LTPEHAFLRTLIKIERFRVVEVPVSTDPRFSGISHHGVWNRIVPRPAGNSPDEIKTTSVQIADFSELRLTTEEL
jgi:hypothetical protein